MMSKNRGGGREGSGRKPNYNEPTKTMRVPESRVIGVVSGNGKYSTLRIFTPTSFNDIQHGIFA